MLDPYRMIIINIIASIFMLLGFIIYKFIYPKKNPNLLISIILISLLPLISILRKGTYESGDLSLHAKLAMDFYRNLTDGNLIPRWAPDFCGGYGCPDFIYLYSLPYYLISLFHFIGFSFINSIKVLLITTFISSGIAVYFFIKQELDEKSAFIAAIFYLYTPYHLVNMHFRVDIAEMTALLFVPLNFLITKKLINKSLSKYFFLQAILILFLIISHQAIALIAFFFITSYGIYSWYLQKQRSIKNIVYYLLSLTAGILISSFYWIPILFEKKYIYWGNNAETYFPNFFEFIYSPWRYGFLFQGPKGQLSLLIGYTQWIVVFIALFLFIKNRMKKKKIFYYFLTVFFIIFFIMNSISKPLWEIIPLIKSFQFSYRLLGLEVFFISALAAFTLYSLKNKILFFIILFFIIGQTILNWGNRRVIPQIDDAYLKNELLTRESWYGDLSRPIFVKLNTDLLKSRSQTSIDILKGESIIKTKELKSIKHVYNINVEKDSYIKENTFYFPGWTLKVDNKIKPINYKLKSFEGIITFPLKKGLHRIELTFEDTTERTFSKLLSIITFLTMIFYLSLDFFKPRLFKSSKIKNSRKNSGGIH